MGAELNEVNKTVCITALLHLTSAAFREKEVAVYRMHYLQVFLSRKLQRYYCLDKCFYCFDDITVSDDETNTCDVDHFFPHTLQPFFPDINLDGVWNLVLACQDCNRGADGKFAKVPATKYLTRLHKRNEFLISSHHPLRETIMHQTGMTEAARREFLIMVDKRAIDALIHRWSTPEKAPATF